MATKEIDYKIPAVVDLLKAIRDSRARIVPASTEIYKIASGVPYSQEDIDAAHLNMEAANVDLSQAKIDILKEKKKPKKPAGQPAAPWQDPEVMRLLQKIIDARTRVETFSTETYKMLKAKPAYPETIDKAILKMEDAKIKLYQARIEIEKEGAKDLNPKKPKMLDA
ncbi:MAG: hypothetical protein ABSG53_00675 [Thermoguttaceae bacterium]